ncbi:MAG: GNAT family N-acetyltransferase [Saprospiraceae bacterium]|nr:GNAT family N-acetyltransferase [Saprospiraceae bacterium]
MFQLTTQRLILREWQAEEWIALHQILSDPKTMRFWPKPFDEKATQYWIKRSQESYTEHGIGRYSVWEKSTRKLIGDCGVFKTLVNGKKEYDLGYIFHYSSWGKGYAVEAAQACLDHAQKTLGIERVIANMASAHYASARVAKRLGMELETIFINEYNLNHQTYLFSTQNI